MSTEYTIKVHAIDTDGLPNMDDLIGRVAFIWDGTIFSGWPINRDPDDDTEEDDEGAWEGSETGSRKFGGVTHWIELPVPAWSLT